MSSILSNTQTKFTKEQAFNKPSLICTDLGAPFEIEIHSITSRLSYLGAVPNAVGVAVGHDEETGTLLAPAITRIPCSQVNKVSRVNKEVAQKGQKGV